MSEHTPLTDAERRSLGCTCTRLDDEWRHIRFCPVPVVERILAARTSTATADTGLRERVRVGFRYQDGEVLSPEREVESADEELPTVVLYLDDEWLTLDELRAATAATGTDQD